MAEHHGNLKTSVNKARRGSGDPSQVHLSFLRLSALIITVEWSDPVVERQICAAASRLFSR